MKHITQAPGGRKYVGEDFLAMQELTLNLIEKFFAQYNTGNYILYGCEITQDAQGNRSITAGVMMHEGKAYSVAVANGIGYPYAVTAVVENVNVPYKTGEGPGYILYQTEEAPPIPGRPDIIVLDGMQRFEAMFTPDKAQVAELALIAEKVDTSSWEHQSISSVDGATDVTLMTKDLGALVAVHIEFIPTDRRGQIVIDNDVFGDLGSAMCADGATFVVELPNLLRFTTPANRFINYKFVLVK